MTQMQLFVTVYQKIYDDLSITAEHEPIVFKLTWVPPILLEQPIMIPIKEV